MDRCFLDSRFLLNCLRMEIALIPELEMELITSLTNKINSRTKKIKKRVNSD